MIEPDIILQLYSMQEQPDYTMLFAQELLHPVDDEIYINEINSILIELQQLSKGTFDFKSKSDKDYIKMYATAERLNKLETYKNFLKHPIHINEYKDKYGNRFLQARASYNADGKIKYTNAYVGTFADFPKGNQDQLAISKGKNLVRAKLKGIYKLI
jgi:hypothetical protein